MFLGQEYLQIETGSDPLLLQLQNEFGVANADPNYNLLWEGNASASDDATLTWMSERCRRISCPEWLQLVATFPWNSVFSSAIDSIWMPVFRNQWREVSPIYDDDYFPRDPRNRRVLHCTYLFGSLNSNEPNVRPPSSLLDFYRRRQTAINLAQRLKDTVTPMGLLAIEGYKGDKDWFSLEDFFPIIQDMGSGQVHLFSVSSELANHPIIADLVRSGKLITHTEGLAWTLEQGTRQGFIRPGTELDEDEGGRRVTLRRHSISIPRELWNRISNSATLLDDSILTPPSVISDDALYWEFRRFLFESGTRPLWSGFARNFAFQREFEDKLHDAVLGRMNREASRDQPIIVHGQTGTGKTVALGKLAYTVAKSGGYPVIFIERKTQRPIYSDIDECCRWMEDHRAQATLIVWDGMLQHSEYHDLQGYLASRGRKAVVVGSAYSLDETGPNLIRVPDQLSVEEAGRFAKFLDTVGIVLTESHREALEKRDPNYLVALYRHLAPARRQIITGVVQELEQLEQQLVDAVNKFEASNQQLGSLAAALLDAGLIDYSRIEEVGLQRETEITSAEIAELVDIVTVPGRYGINTPIEVLARTWGKPDFTNLAQILQSFDLIQAFEDTAGRIVVGPRHSLEARLIVQARLGSSQNEANIVSRIVKSIRPWTWGVDENDEVDFAIELLRAVGPQSNEKSRFEPFFRDLAEAISALRENRNIRSPRLMLQEANFFREWVTSLSRRNSRPEDASAILDRAKSTLQEALEMLADNRQWRLRTFIATELASTFGAATLDSINSSANAHVIEENFRQVLEAVKQARTIDYNTYNPVDVLVWSTRAFVERSAIDEITRTEAMVDVLDALETLDPDLLNSGDLEQFHRRRLQVGTLLGDAELSDSAFESLADMGSAAGFYIRARHIGGSPLDLHLGQGGSLSSFTEAQRYLENHRQAIQHDARCLNLLFNYWWLTQTGHRPFAGERVVLNFQQSDWLYCLQLIRDLKASPDSRRGLTLSFLEAISLFHLDQISHAIQLFQEIEGESYTVASRRRVLRSFLASEPSGEPRKFHGTVRSVEQGGRRGQVSVEELRQNIIFLPGDFGRTEIRHGDSLGEFYIAFNFIGPIADPPTRSEV